MTMLDKLTSGDFSSFINQPFRIHVESLEPLTAQLIEVTELGVEPAADEEDARRRAFSIVLRGPKEVVLPQRIYPVEHPEMGTLPLFLVPLGPDKQGMCYEAVFT